jgi:hypothetical protein
MKFYEEKDIYMRTIMVNDLCLYVLLSSKIPILMKLYTLAHQG